MPPALPIVEAGPIVAAGPEPVGGKRTGFSDGKAAPIGDPNGDENCVLACEVNGRVGLVSPTSDGLGRPAPGADSFRFAPGLGTSVSLGMDLRLECRANGSVRGTVRAVLEKRPLRRSGELSAAACFR